MSEKDVDKGLFREVMGRFATGVTVITTSVEDEVHGMAANAFMAVSLEPPLCVVSVSKKAHLHERLLRSRRFAVSVLNQEQQYLSNHFAGWRISGMQPEFVDRAGMPTIRNAIAVITADVIESHGCGDHTLFVGEIDFMEAKGATSPLLFYRGRYAKVSREAPIGEAEPPAFW